VGLARLGRLLRGSGTWHIRQPYARSWLSRLLSCRTRLAIPCCRCGLGSGMRSWRCYGLGL